MDHSCRIRLDWGPGTGTHAIVTIVARRLPVSLVPTCRPEGRRWRISRGGARVSGTVLVQTMPGWEAQSRNTLIVFLSFSQDPGEGQMPWRCWRCWRCSSHNCRNSRCGCVLWSRQFMRETSPTTPFGVVPRRSMIALGGTRVLKVGQLTASATWRLALARLPPRANRAAGTVAV
jgi:hypothetical protein